jgi:hypothetical protein
MGSTLKHLGVQVDKIDEQVFTGVEDKGVGLLKKSRVLKDAKKIYFVDNNEKIVREFVEQMSAAGVEAVGFHLTEAERTQEEVREKNNFGYYIKEAKNLIESSSEVSEKEAAFLELYVVTAILQAPDTGRLLESLEEVRGLIGSKKFGEFLSRGGLEKDRFLEVSLISSYLSDLIKFVEAKEKASDGARMTGEEKPRKLDLLTAEQVRSLTTLVPLVVASRIPYSPLKVHEDWRMTLTNLLVEANNNLGPGEDWKVERWDEKTCAAASTALRLVYEESPGKGIPSEMMKFAELVRKKAARIGTSYEPPKKYAGGQARMTAEEVVVYRDYVDDNLVLAERIEKPENLLDEDDVADFIKALEKSNGRARVFVHPGYLSETIRKLEKAGDSKTAGIYQAYWEKSSRIGSAASSTPAQAPPR